ncbi:MAG: DUF480 domain-containing protein [Acidobacteriota bacterium]|nr:MAG: DUF480 domain-containing protein [Acidobacteriota bacterium]
MQNLIELNAHCRRVLGALLEKEQTTPDYYPLTLNALITACNQTTNRNPVMSMERYEVLRALHALEREHLVQRETGPRADRWSHLLIQPRYSRPPAKALLTVLILRGSQTIGELKARTDRMHAFESLESVEEQLRGLAEGDPPLVRELPKQPGQKESRWQLALDADVDDELPVPVVRKPEPVSPESGGEESLEDRVRKLEEQVAEILRRLE